MLRIWQFIRDNWLSNHVFDSTTALLDHCCDAWNKVGGSALDYHVHWAARLAHGF
jgi:hypothetical protein